MSKDEAILKVLWRVLIVTTIIPGRSSLALQSPECIMDILDLFTDFKAVVLPDILSYHHCQVSVKARQWLSEDLVTREYANVFELELSYLGCPGGSDIFGYIPHHGKEFTEDLESYKHSRLILLKVSRCTNGREQNAVARAFKAGIDKMVSETKTFVLDECFRTRSPKLGVESKEDLKTACSANTLFSVVSWLSHGNSPSRKWAPSFSTRLERSFLSHIYTTPQRKANFAKLGQIWKAYLILQSGEAVRRSHQT